MCNFKTRLEANGHLKNLIERALWEVSFAGRQSALKKQAKKTKGKFMPFVTTYHPGAKNLKQILIQSWNLVQNQLLLKTIYRTPPVTMSYKKEKSLKDMLVRAKLRRPTCRYRKITQGSLYWPVYDLFYLANQFFFLFVFVFVWLFVCLFVFLMKHFYSFGVLVCAASMDILDLILNQFSWRVLL